MREEKKPRKAIEKQIEQHNTPVASNMLLCYNVIQITYAFELHTQYTYTVALKYGNRIF